MKHPVLMLLVLAVVLVPWLAVVSLVDWIRSQFPGPQEALKD